MQWNFWPPASATYRLLLLFHYPYEESLSRNLIICGIYGSFHESICIGNTGFTIWYARDRGWSISQIILPVGVQVYCRDTWLLNFNFSNIHIILLMHHHCVNSYSQRSVQRFQNVGSAFRKSAEKQTWVITIIWL